MAIAQNNIIMQSDINSIFSSFNDFISNFGGGISQIPAVDIPAQGSVIDDHSIALLNAKIDAFCEDEFLKSKNWWIKSEVTEGEKIYPIDLTNIQTTVSNFASVRCRNIANNTYGGGVTTCSQTCNKSCSHSSHTNTCSHACNKSCSHSSHTNACSHACSRSCSHSTCGYSCANCGWVCAQNHEHQGWAAGGVYCGPVTSSGIVYSHNSYTEYNYACFQRNNCNEGCLNMITWSGGFNWSCTWSGGTCNNTCSVACSNTNHGQTCSHNCSVACSHSSHGQTCSHNCSVSCQHGSQDTTCTANTAVIDITCSQSTKTNTTGG